VIRGRFFIFNIFTYRLQCNRNLHAFLIYDNCLFIGSGTDNLGHNTHWANSLLVREYLNPSLFKHTITSRSIVA